MGLLHHGTVYARGLERDDDRAVQLPGFPLPRRRWCGGEPLCSQSCLHRGPRRRPRPLPFRVFSQNADDEPAHLEPGRARRRALRSLLSDRCDSGGRDDRCRNLHDRWFLGNDPTVPGCDLVLGPGSRMVAPPRRRRLGCRRRGPAVSEEPSVHGTECERHAPVHVVCWSRRNLHIECVGCLSDKGWDSIVAVPRWAYADAGDGMKKFATELRGKTVMTNDGQILGTIENFIVNTKSGKLSDVLVAPAENTPTKGLKTDPEGRIVLPFQGMRAVKDVVVMNL